VTGFRVRTEIGDVAGVGEREGADVMSKSLDFKFIASLLLGLLIQAAGIVWWASKLQADVQHNDFQIKMMAKDVEKHAIFVRDWPSGKYGSGSLPDDVRQNLHIENLRRQLDTISEAFLRDTQK
tara:strand:- start:4519 stop:4890 length:372 start_codon:yes stop_codon:yes gene_type:complete